MSTIEGLEHNEARLCNEGMDLLFREARTHSAWHPRGVSEETLHEVYNLAKFGPTSANTSPARIVFIKSEAAKARLLPAMAPLNVEKTRTAPVTAIIAYDLEFYEKLPTLSPPTDPIPFFHAHPCLA